MSVGQFPYDYQTEVVYDYANEGVKYTKYPVDVAKKEFIIPLEKKDVLKINKVAKESFDHYQINLKDGTYITASEHHYGNRQDSDPLIWCFHHILLGKKSEAATQLDNKYLKLFKDWYSEQRE